MFRHDESFACMGTTCRVLIEDPARDPSAAGAWARRHLEHAARTLTRFDDASELSRLNADPRETVPVSPLLRAAIGAALWAAAATDGLVDPTLHDAICHAGYAASMADTLCESPPRPRENAQPRPASASPDRAWRSVRLGAHTVTRPPGLTLDTGGTTKGLLADSVAHALEANHFTAYVIDCGGDMRIGGTRDIHVANPFDPDHHAATLTITNGAAATSAIHRRAWDNGHHLLDPSTSEPAYTGITAATALAPTAVEAEAHAKAALLSGGRTPIHGVLIHDDARIEHLAPTHKERLAA